jgi:hypothetical protein
MSQGSFSQHQMTNSFASNQYNSNPNHMQIMVTPFAKLTQAIGTDGTDANEEAN